MLAMKKLNKYHFSILAIIITLAGTACWQLIASPYSDDFAYMQIALDDEVGAFWTGFGDKLETFDDAIRSSINHYHNVNSRLANILCIFSMLIPSWIPDLLHAIMITSMMVLILLCINGRKALQSPVLVTLVSLSMWVILPWHDNMVSSDFLFNYAWTTVMTLSFLLIFRQNKLSNRQLIGACILAFLTAWMHEGFTIPTGIACITILIIDKENRRQRMVLLGALALGALLCAGPGTIGRFFEHSEQHQSVSMTYYITRYLSQFTILWIYLFLLGIIAFKQGFKAVVSLLREHSPYILGAATSFAISIMASMGNRALWIALIFITIITYKTLPIAFPNFPKHIKQLLAVILLTSTTSFLAGLCYWQNIISSQQRIMLKELIASNSPCTFIDLTSPQQIPWWTMAIPRQYCYDSNMAILTISSYAEKTTHAVFAPARFKDLEFDQWDKIPGDNPFRGQYPLLCTTDSLISQVKLTVGKSLPAMSPIDRFLASLSGGETAERTIKAYPHPTFDAKGNRIYVYMLESAGLTITNREILKIDVVK